jgi:hypothetical protein
MDCGMDSPPPLPAVIWWKIMAMNLCYRPIISGMMSCRYAFFLHLTDEDKKTLFYIAAKRNKLEFVSLVIEHGFKPSYDEFTWVCSHGYAEVCKILLRFIDPSGGDNTALYNSCVCGYLDVVKALIDDGRAIARPSDRLNACLFKSVYYRHYHITEMLLKCENVDPSWDDTVMLYLATTSEPYEILELLLECGRVKITRANYDWLIRNTEGTSLDKAYNILKKYESVVVM